MRRKKAELAPENEANELSDLKLKTVLDACEDKYGKGTIMLAGVTTSMGIERVSLNHSALDEILGGGIPLGRIIEVYGPPSSGKTSLALDFISAFQRSGHRSAFIDVEHALDPAYAAAVDVDIDSLLISQPNSAEQALDIMEMLVKSDAVGLIVIDSVDALVPQAVIDGEVGDITVAALPRILGPVVRKINALIGKSKCVIIFINQERSNIKMSKYEAGPDKVTSGGASIPYYASVRLETKRKEILYKTVSGDKIPVGQISTVNARKNKVGIPYKKCEVELRYPVLGQRAGIDRIAPFVNAALDSGKIVQSGSWFSDAEGNRIAQGRDNLIKALSESPELLETLK